MVVFWFFTSELWYLCLLWLLLLILKMSGWIVKCGCVCLLLLLYRSFSSCCELLWGVQLTQSLWAVSPTLPGPSLTGFFSFFPCGDVPTCCYLDHHRECCGWVFSMTTWHLSASQLYWTRPSFLSPWNTCPLSLHTRTLCLSPSPTSPLCHCPHWFISLNYSSALF